MWFRLLPTVPVEDKFLMMKRFLICLACWVIVLGAIGNGWAMPIDSGGATPSTVHLSPTSHSPQPMTEPFLAPFDIEMDGCIGHAHSASGGCTIDTVASSLAFDPPDRIWRIDGWIDTVSLLVSATLPPTSPPPIRLF